MSAPHSPEHTSRRHAMTALKVVVSSGALTWLLTRQPPGQLLNALARIPWTHALGALAMFSVPLLLGTLRWSLLLRAYGATRTPKMLPLLRAYSVGLFYNTYLPGGVGGDLVRGVMTRAAFEENATVASLAVVFVERLLGMTGLLVLAACAWQLSPFEAGPPGQAAALAIPIMTALLISVLSVAPWPGSGLPTKLKSLTSRLPRCGHPAALWKALGLSILGHLVISLAGHILVASIAPETPLLSSLIVVPLAAAAAFFPLTWAGVGARDLAFVGLYALVGVDSAVATAAAFSLLGCQLIVAGTGGLWQLSSPPEPGQPTHGHGP